jgi:hypothetical protein
MDVQAIQAKQRSETGRGPSISGPPIDPPDSVVGCGGEGYYPVDFTPARFPIGPRVELVDGELEFLDEEIHDLGSYIDEPDL